MQKSSTAKENRDEKRTDIRLPVAKTYKRTDHKIEHKVKGYFFVYSKLVAIKKYFS